MPKNMAVEDEAAKERDVLPMRTILGCAALALAFSSATIPAQAKGCITGALIGQTDRAIARPARLTGSCRRLRDRPPRSEAPETIKIAAAEHAPGHSSLSLERRFK